MHAIGHCWFYFGRRRREPARIEPAVNSLIELMRESFLLPRLRAVPLGPADLAARKSGLMQMF
jgi:hypothetical protein